MQKFLFLLTFVILSTSISAQTFVPTKSTFSFDINSCSKVDVVNIDGTNFDVFSTKKGSKFIKVGEVGKEHPMWIGEPTTKSCSYNGKSYSYRISKSGKTLILILENNKPKIIYGTIQ